MSQIMSATIPLVRNVINVKFWAKHIAIAITFGAVYFSLIVFNPMSPLTGIASLQNFASIRWANILRGFVMAFPAAVIGLAGGSYAYSVYIGRVTFGAYPILTLINAAFSMFIISTFRIGGRTIKKDLIAITIMGAFIGTTVTLNLSGIALLIDGEPLRNLFTIAAGWKILTHIGVCLAGYPIARYFESIVKKYKGEK